MSAYEIKLYPNPTSDLINLKFIAGATDSNEPVNIVIIDNWGRIVESSTIAVGDYSKTTLSFNNYVPGIYYVKCFNNSLEKYFKVIKI